MNEEDIKNAISQHNKRNAQLLRLLKGKGISLTEERPVDVHFWSSGQADAAILARELYKRGYLVKVIASSNSGQENEKWNVEVGANIPPQRIMSEEFTEELVRLAVKHDSVYDGWGTSI